MTPDPTSPPATPAVAVVIPRTPLGTEIHEAAHIQAQMLAMLRELEQAALAAEPSLASPAKTTSASATPLLIDPAKPGAWRHPAQRRPHSSASAKPPLPTTNT
jgi:hypothetical protein